MSGGVGPAQTPSPTGKPSLSRSRSPPASIGRTTIAFEGDAPETSRDRRDRRPAAGTATGHVPETNWRLTATLGSSVVRENVGHLAGAGPKYPGPVAARGDDDRAWPERAVELRSKAPRATVAVEPGFQGFSESDWAKLLASKPGPRSAERVHLGIEHRAERARWRLDRRLRAAIESFWYF